MLSWASSGSTRCAGVGGLSMKHGWPSGPGAATISSNWSKRLAISGHPARVGGAVPTGRLRRGQCGRPTREHLLAHRAREVLALHDPPSLQFRTDVLDELDVRARGEDRHDVDAGDAVRAVLLDQVRDLLGRSHHAPILAVVPGE